MDSTQDTTHEAPEEGAAPRPLGYWLRALPPLWGRAAAEAMSDADDLDEDDPRAAWRRASAAVQDRVAATVSPDDLAVTVATLEAVARELGYDERAARGRGRRAFGPRGMGGFGPMGFGPWGGGRRFGGFGPFGFGFGPRGFGPGFGPGAHADHDGACGSRGGHGAHRHGAHEHGDHGRKGRRHGERSYERGFTAGFDAARRGDAPAPQRGADAESEVSRTEAPVA